MYELLYVGEDKEADKITNLIKKEYPKAKTNKVWDEIHETRLEVKIEDIEKTDFFIFLEKNKIAEISLGWQLKRLKGD